MSEVKANTQTLSAYERLHGVPERLSEYQLWAREGFVDSGYLEAMARHGMAKSNARDIGRYAMAGVLATPSYYKAVIDAEQALIDRDYAHSGAIRALAQTALATRITPHHLFDNMEIFHKELERNEQGAITAVRPGVTPAQFLDAGGDAYELRNPDRWVVAVESLRSTHYLLQENLGQFVMDGEFVRPQLENFGNDEMRALEWAAVLVRTPER